MKKLLTKENLKNILMTTVYVVFGVLFLVMPVRILTFTESVLCFILLGAGILCILVYSIMSTEDKNFKVMLFGVIAVILGMCMMFVSRFFGIFLSILVALGGVSLLLSGIKLKQEKQKTWITDFVVGIVIIALSITAIVLSGTNVAKRILGIVFGVILLTNGIYAVVNWIVLSSKSKKKKSLIDGSEELKSDEIIKQSNEEEPEVQETTNDKIEKTRNDGEK